MGKFVVALYTGGLAIIARVALQMPKLARLATAVRKVGSTLESVDDVMANPELLKGKSLSEVRKV